MRRSKRWRGGVLLRVSAVLLAVMLMLSACAGGDGTMASEVTTTEPTSISMTVPETQAPATEPTEAPTTEPETEATEAPTTEPVTEPTEDAGQHYVLNKNTKKFHYPTCSSAADIKEKNREDYYGDREDLIEEGFEPCKRCEP